MRSCQWFLMTSSDQSKVKKILLVWLIILKNKRSVQFTAKTQAWKSTFNFSPKQRPKQWLWSNYKDGCYVGQSFLLDYESYTLYQCFINNSLGLVLSEDWNTNSWIQILITHFSKSVCTQKPNYAWRLEELSSPQGYRRSWWPNVVPGNMLQIKVCTVMSEVRFSTPLPTSFPLVLHLYWVS